MSAQSQEIPNTGYIFKNGELLMAALTHSSYVKAMDNTATHNERLEFLGDAVLELVTSEYLYTSFCRTEGEMTKLRAGAVNENALYSSAKKLSLGQYLRLSRGEEHSGGREKPGILADALEAVIGAIYLDGGFLAAKEFILSKVLSFDTMDDDYKTQLQELVQGAHMGDIRYELLDAQGPDHMRIFTMSVSVNGISYGSGSGRSKQEAGQMAAKMALSALSNKQ